MTVLSEVGLLISAVSGLLQCPLATLSSVEFPADYPVVSIHFFFVLVYTFFVLAVYLEFLIFYCHVTDI